MSQIISDFESERGTELKTKFHPFKKRFQLKLPAQRRDFQEYHKQRLDTMFLCRSCNSTLG